MLAEQIAASQIESIRQLPYTSVGLVNGNPGGTVVASKSISIGALSATETTQIRWVTDATPNAFTTKADYKRVTVTINRLSDGRQLTQQTTYVGPANQASYGGLNKAIAQVQVMDMGTNQPVSGVPVSLQTGPSAPQGDTTDGSGTVVFPALTANPASGGQAFYDLAITPPAGYSALTDDVSPATAAHTKLAVSQNFSTVLRVYKPSTVGFTIVNAGGGTFPGAVTVTMTSSLKPVTTSFSGGIGSLGNVPPAQFTVSAATTNSGVGWATGVTSASVVQTVPTSYPTNLTSAFTLTLPYLVVTVKQVGQRRLPGRARGDRHRDGRAGQRQHERDRRRAGQGGLRRSQRRQLHDQGGLGRPQQDAHLADGARPAVGDRDHELDLRRVPVTRCETRPAQAAPGGGGHARASRSSS